MLIDFALALIFILVLTFIGLPLLPKFIRLTGIPRLLLGTITALTLLVSVSSWIVALNLSIKVFWAIVFALTLNVLLKFATLKSSLVLLLNYPSLIKVRILTISLVGLFITSLHNPSFFSQFVSFRNGPDLVGWTKGAQFFCSDSRLSDLNSRVISTLNAEKFTDTLKLPGPLNEQFLYRLPSFSDQVTAEFLLGAHRTGLPGFLGAICNVLPDQSSIRVMSAIHCAVILILFSFLFEYFLGKNLTTVNSTIFALAGTVNFGVLSVMLEGGLGQILMLPILSLFFFMIFNRDIDIKEFGFIVFIALTLTFSTYLDFVYFFGIIVVAALFVLKTHAGISIKSSIVTTLLSSFLALFASWPIVTSLPRLFWERFFGHPGGWNMGRVPTLVDLLGLSVWLPSDSVTNFPNQLILISILFLISFFLIMSALFFASKETLVIFIAYLMTFCSIFVLVYSKSPANNYPLFKFGPYLGVFAPILFLELRNFRNSDLTREKVKNRFNAIFDFNVIASENRRVSKKEQGISPLAYTLVFVSLISSMVWSSGWYANRQFSISGETTSVMKPYLDKFDVVANGFNGAGYAKLVLMGDLHYLAESRGFSVSVNESFPTRSKIYLLGPAVCLSAPRCLVTKDGKDFEVKLLRSFKEFDIYR
jgi:hypothetical protein